MSHVTEPEAGDSSLIQKHPLSWTFYHLFLIINQSFIILRPWSQKPTRLLNFHFTFLLGIRR